MDYSQNTLTFLSTEVTILFGHGSFTPPKLPNEPPVNWEVVKPTLQRIEATMHRTREELCGYSTDASGASRSPEVFSLNAETAQEITMAFAVLAERALAYETAQKRRFEKRFPKLAESYMASIAIRANLRDELQELAETTKKGTTTLLKVCCGRN